MFQPVSSTIKWNWWYFPYKYTMRIKKNQNIWCKKATQAIEVCMIACKKTKIYEKATVFQERMIGRKVIQEQFTAIGIMASCWNFSCWNPVTVHVILKNWCVGADLVKAQERTEWTLARRHRLLKAQAVWLYCLSQFT